jgi:hypothetical protein
MFVTSLFGNTNFDAHSAFQGGTSNTGTVAPERRPRVPAGADPNLFDEEGT